MSEVALTFRPGDPVPSWFIGVEPRDDVAAHMPRVVAPLVFAAHGRVLDDGARYVVRLDDGSRSRSVVTGDLRCCHIVAERPILWADGSYWPGCGVPPPADWTPDPDRVRRIAAVGRQRAVMLAAHSTPPVSAPTYYKAVALVAAGAGIGVLIMLAAVSVVLAVAS